MVVLFCLSLIFVWSFAHRLDEYYVVDRRGHIQDYLNGISPSVVYTCDLWAMTHQSNSWLCGPTSYAVAKELNRRFFSDQLPICSSRLYPNCIVIRLGVFRSPLGLGHYVPTEHVWVEVYWHGQILFVDPTYAQFDRQGSMAYAWFVEGDKTSMDVVEFKRFLRLYPLTKKDLELIGPLEKMDAEVYRVMLLLDSGKVPQNWLEWRTKLLNDGVFSVDF